MVSKFFAFVLAVSLFLSACDKKPVKRSIYSWKTQINLNKTNILGKNSNKIEKIYIRFFDVSWKNGMPYPKAPLLSDTVVDIQTKLIPVIFIENHIFKKMHADSIAVLAKNINNKIAEINTKIFNSNSTEEIQLDCDWSKTTKDNFFALINELKKQSGKTISATVRLHQLRYPEQTGVPPADKGVLMYYNMGQLKNPQETNSILNNNIGQEYLQHAKPYPLELSLALPIYSWSVLFRDEKFKGLLNNIHEKNIDSLKFLRKQSRNLYIVQEDTVYNKVYFRYGDKLRLEKVTYEKLEKAKSLCRKFVNDEIILFSYSPETNFFHNEEAFDRIYSYH